MTTQRVAWRRSGEVATDDVCTLTVRDAGLSLVGTVLGSQNSLPIRIEYRVLADSSGLTTAAHVRDLRGFGQRTLALARDSRGNWTIDGVADRSLRGCTDVDLGCSPSTSTLPIRRLRLAIGASRKIQAAGVRFPELVVEKSAQSYTRIDEFTYRYASGTFLADLIVDDDGLVMAYADWQRTGVAVGREDSEPLDAHR